MGLGAFRSDCEEGVLGFGGKKSIIFDIDKGLPWYLVRSWVLRDF